MSRGLYRCNRCHLHTDLIVVSEAPHARFDHGQGRPDPSAGSSTSTPSVRASKAPPSDPARGVAFGARWTTVRRGHNLRRPTDNTFNTTNAALEIDEFDVTTLPNGRTRMYVRDREPAVFSRRGPRFWRTDDAGTAAPSSRDLTTAAGSSITARRSAGTTTYVFTPAAIRTSSTSAARSATTSFGRARRTAAAYCCRRTAGATWSDLTQDGDPNKAEACIPTHHELVMVTGNPLQFISASDGGVVGSDGRFADVSYKCDRGGSTGHHGFLQEPPQPGSELADQHEQRAVHAAVPQHLGERAAAAEPSPGRHAGQRNVPVQRLPARCGSRRSTATAASPASASPTTTFASTRSSGRRPT